MNWYVGLFWMLLAILTAMAWAWSDPVTPRWRAALQPEVAVAGLYWLAAAGSTLIPIGATLFARLEASILVIDVLLFAGLLVVALKFRKWWVTWAAALQLLASTAHVARLVTPSMWRLGYQVMEEASSYPALILLGIGIVQHRLQQRRNRLSGSSGWGDRQPRRRPPSA